MSDKMPRTPFSTPLSGSAREAELRLRNIFSGPKKRPPALFLALIFAACLLCGNLVSCQVAQAEPDHPDIPVDWENLAEPDLSLAPVDWDRLPELDPVYTLEENGNVLITNLGDAIVEWNRSSTGNFLYFAQDPAFFCPSLAGKVAEGNAQWKDRENRVVSVTISVNDDRLEDGAIDGYYLQFVVDLGKGTVTESSFTSDVGDGTLELSEEEMLYAGRVLAKLMNGAEWTAIYPAPEPMGTVDTLPFDRPLELYFLSGAGGWSTDLRVLPDGSFEGYYHDSDMGDGGESYPHGTEYVCPFHGSFRDIVPLTNTSWSLTLEELVLDTGRPVGEEWIEDGVRYISSDPYGFDLPGGGALEPGAQFMLYSPEAKGYAPTDDLYGMNGEDENSPLYEFWTWWPSRQGWGPDTTLDCWGLHSLASGYGFFS